MKLSELMERGLQEVEKRGLKRSEFIALDDEGCCWLGAIALGADSSFSLLSTGGAIEEIKRRYPAINDTYVSPVTGDRMPLWNVLTGLHDGAHWSFEQELAWLREQNL